MSKSRTGNNSLVPRFLGAAVCFFPAACCWALIAVITTSPGTGATVQGDTLRSGHATATHCSSTGLLYLDLKEQCRLEVTRDDGTSTTATSEVGDFASEDIGQRVRATLHEVSNGQGGTTRDVVARDVDRPWAWLGWVLSIPLFLITGLFIVSGLVFLKPPKPDGKKRRGQPANAPVNQQQ
ncbi:hypothetical protein GCM10027174_17590 [Salinifilum aidingensis]